MRNKNEAEQIEVTSATYVVKENKETIKQQL